MHFHVTEVSGFFYGVHRSFYLMMGLSVFFVIFPVIIFLNIFFFEEVVPLFPWKPYSGGNVTPIKMEKVMIHNR